MEFQKKTRQILLYFFFILLSCLFLASCSKHNLTSTWTNSSLEGMKVEDVLVIGLGKHPTTRRIFEKAFVEDLQAENVKAYPSHKVTENTLQRTKEALMGVIKKTDAKTVVITRLLDRKTKTLYQRSVGRTTSPHDEPFGAFFQSRVPQTSATKTFVYLESSLYNVKTGQLLWSATVEAKDPVMTKDYMKKVTNLFIKDLKKEGLL